MATLGQPGAHASPPFPSKLSARPPVHDGSRESLDRANGVARHDAGLNVLERRSDVDNKSSQRRRNLLDYVANNVDENYLDGGYREDDGDGSTDGDDGGFESEGLRSGRHRSIPSHSAPSSVSDSGRNAVINPHEVDSIQLSLMVAEEAERKQRARAEKELAWQKVRQLLVEEEEKATTRNDPSAESTNSSADSLLTSGDTDKERCNTVKLMDALARSSGEDFSYNRSISSDGDAAPVVDSSLAQPPAASSGETNSTTPAPEVKDQVKDLPQKLASHMDRMGNKLAQLLNRGQNSDEDMPEALKPRFKPSAPFHGKENKEAFVAGKSSVRLALLATLEQVAKTCQRTELSETSMARICSHLTAIEQIAREDMDKKSGQLKRGLRRLSNTQWAKSDQESTHHEKEFRDPAPPKAASPSEYLSIPSAPPAIIDNPQAKVSPTVLDSFKAFDAAQDLGDILAAFSNLLTDCGLNGIMVDEPWHVYCHIKAAVYSKLSFRHKQLFKLLDARLNVDVYKRRPASRKRVCIIGAGPVGLRAAVEAALLGGQVVVLEKRKNFSRENMLHLWPWVVQDLTSLGAKVLFSQFSKSNSYFHVSTRQLQVILLKVALLLGVTVFSSTEFDSVVPPGLEENGGRPFYTLTTQPQIPMMEFTAVLGASGVNDKLAEFAGIDRFVFCREEALGIVCYFPNLGTSEETKVKEFSWTTQLKHQMLDKLRDGGIDMENIMYYRGEMHYLVMTPKRQNLLDWKVVNENHASPVDLVMDTNVNQSVLQEFVKTIVDFAGIPRKTDFTRVSLFDFSPRTRADKAATILSSNGNKLYVGLVGDSLLEPLWHESVGVCRGFLSAMDGVWMVAQIGRKADEQLLADREVMYQVTQRLSGRHRDEMQKNVRKYTVDPRSRYLAHFPRVV
ncbi:hypothetical protein PRIC1_004159 [Phytophthora ramorum]